MPTSTFFRLPDERRERLVNEAIVKFSDRSDAEASLSRIARRASIPKGSVYQYFEDKLDLYRWLLTDEAPRRKREFVGAATQDEDFWTRLETFIERGMAFLVEPPASPASPPPPRRPQPTYRPAASTRPSARLASWSSTPSWR